MGDNVEIGIYPIRKALDKAQELETEGHIRPELFANLSLLHFFAALRPHSRHAAESFPLL